MALTATQLARVGVRFLAFYLVLKGLPSLAYIIAFALRGINGAIGRVDGVIEYVTADVASMLLMLGTGVALWVLADKIARLIVGSAEDDSRYALTSSHGLEVMAISIVGLVIMVGALASVTRNALLLYHASAIVPTPAGSTRLFTERTVAQVIGSSLELALGLWLITGARFWARVLERIRNFGDEEKSLT